MQSPQIVLEKIPFSLASGKFRDEKQNRQIAQVVDLPKELLLAANSPQRRVWAKHLRGELQARAKRLFPSSPQQQVSSLLTIIRQVGEDDILVQEFHEMLPKVADESLKFRIRELLACTVPKLVELEKRAVMTILDSLSKDYLVTFHAILMEMFAKNESEVLMELYEHCWSRYSYLLILSFIIF